MKIMANATAAFIRLYQVTLSPLKRLLLGPYAACRFHPTCSEYARQAVLSHGFFQGGWMGVRRLFRCHPFNPGGYDPVPEVCCQHHSGPKNSVGEEAA